MPVKRSQQQRQKSKSKVVKKKNHQQPQTDTYNSLPDVGPLYTLMKERVYVREDYQPPTNVYPSSGDSFCDDCHTQISWTNLESFFIQLEQHGIGRCIPSNIEAEEMDYDNTPIPCIYCGQVLLGFAELNKHFTIQQQMPVLLCKKKPLYVTRQKAVSNCYIASKPKTENEEMKLPAPVESDASQGKAAKAGGGGDGVPFLKMEHLSLNTRREAVITDVQIPPRGGFNDVLVKIAMDGHPFIWGLKAKNPNYVLLCKQFGEDSDGWIEKKILLGIEKEQFTEKKYPKVYFPERSSKAAR